MSKTVKVPLSTRLEGHGGIISALEFREPRWAEIMTHGEPYRVHRTEAGEPIVIVDHPAVRAYAEACLVRNGEHVGTTLDQLGVHDSREVAEAILGFFLPGKSEGEASGSTA